MRCLLMSLFFTIDGFLSSYMSIFNFEFKVFKCWTVLSFALFRCLNLIRVWHSLEDSVCSLHRSCYVFYYPTLPLKESIVMTSRWFNQTAKASLKTVYDHNPHTLLDSHLHLHNTTKAPFL